jgi:cell division protein FtsW
MGQMINVSAGLLKKQASKNAALNNATAVILITTSILCVFGLLMVFSSSFIDALYLYGAWWQIFLEQLVWMTLACACMITAIRYFSLERIKKLTPLILIIGFCLLIAVLVPGVGVKSMGSIRWIGIGFFHIQPSEFMKLVMVIYGSLYFSKNLNWKDVSSSFVPPTIVFGICTALMMLQPDMGTSIIIVCIYFAMLFAAGAPRGLLLKVFVVITITGFAAAFAAPYRRARLLSFLHPFNDPLGNGYQVVQSLVSMGSGHILGNGLGASTFKWGFLPNDHTDFIFAVIGQELGMLGSLLIVLIFLAFTWAGFIIAKNAKDKFSYLLAVGITVWIAVQAAINIGAVIGLLPVTGIPLPFISFGGSSLVINLVAVGILVTVARESRKVPLLLWHPR